MRPACSLAFKRISVLSIVLAFFALVTLASAQTETASKRRVSRHQPVAVRAAAQPAKGGTPPPPATTDTWTGSGGNSNWSTTGNWNNGLPSGQNVLINLTTAATTMDQSFSIGTLTLSNAGDSVGINNNTSMTVGGNISNNGTLSLNSGGSATDLIIGASAITLSGSGTLNMSNNGNNNIVGAASGDVLTNQETIQGSGNIGSSLAIVNSGTIDANQSNQLNLATSSGTTNSGILEATAGGTLALNGNTITNTGGTIQANGVSGNGAVVNFENGVTVVGGTLSNNQFGSLNEANSATFNGITLSTGSTLNVQNNTTATLVGTIVNNGTLAMNSGGSTTSVELSGNVTLNGTGTLSMSNNANNVIFGAVATDTLTNNQTIQGSGNIGNNQMTLVNTGTIDATQSNPLYVDASNGTTNTGTLEATTGTLVLYGNSGTTTITNTGGTIKSTGSDVQLQSGVIINGGTLTTSGAGIIHTIAGQSGTLENLTNAGNYQVDNNSVTNLVGTITNNGNINMASGGSATELVLSTGNVSLNGTGTLTMSNNGNNWIYSSTASGTLTVGSGQTISGSGQIGWDPIISAPQLTLVNNGIIDATQSNPLYIRTSGGTTNTGTLEATSGTMILYGNTITQTGAGNISSTGSDVQLQNGVTIIGGTLNTSGAGLIHTVAGNSGTLENLTNAGKYQVDNNSTTILIGTITNNNNINLASGGSFTDLQISGNVTLNGTGTVTMSNNGNNSISGAAAGNTLTVGSGQTISGAGDIGDNQMALVNNGVINATQTNALYVDTSNGTTNNNLLEATGGGTLILYGRNDNSVPNTITNTNGTISAGTGSVVDLQNGIIISGGTITTSGTGLIHTQAGQTATLENLTNSGNFQVDNNSVTTLVGTITNNGNMNLASGGSATEFQLSGNVTLSGTGTLTMSNNGNNFIFGAVAANTFTNQETIQGSGNIGNGQMVFVNQGTVNANQSNALVIQTSGGTTNTGILEATAGGTLVLNGSSGGNIANTGGTIQAIGATGNGAVVNLENGVTITGGTITSNGFGSFNVLNTAALIGLTNTGTVNVGNNTALTLAGTIVNNGAINLNSGGSTTQLILNGNVALNGTGIVTMSNNGNNIIIGTAAANTLTVGSTETIQGAGNIGDNKMALVNNGTIDANQSNVLYIDTSNGTTNTGTLEATGGGNLSLYGNTVTNTGAGTVVAGAGSTVYLQGNVTVKGGSLTGTGTFIENGTAGGATLSGLTNASTVQVANNTELTLAGTIVNNGSIQENSGGSTTQILISGNVTLNGTGTLAMSNNGNNIILGAASTDVFTNASTIEGAGNIGNASMGLVNSGTIIANVSNTLNIDVNTKNFNNKGTIEANSADLNIIGPTGNTTFFTNYNATSKTLTGGTYIANAGNIGWLGANVTTLAANVTEENGGQILNNFNGTGSNALVGLTSITSKGALTIGGPTFVDAGAFSNAGSLTILTGESFTVGSLAQISGSTLTAGTYVLDANLNLSGATQNITTNSATLTLGGGTIENANSTNALAGLASNTKSLTLANNATFTTAGNFTNTGTLTINSGSAFTVTGTLAQISGSTLSGGTFVLGGNLNVGSGINITTNSSTLTLEGGTIMSGATNALAGLNKNTKSLTLANNANFTTTGNFTNSGTLTVNSGSTFAVAPGSSLTNYNSTTNTLTGGTYVVGGTLSASGLNIVTDAANITLNGTGELENSTSSTNALANLNTIASAGSLTLASNANFTTAGNLTNSGKLTVNSGSTFDVTGTLTNLSAGTLTGGTYTVGGTMQLASANGGITTNAANLTLAGTTAKIMDGASNALAGFNNNTGTFALSTGAKLTTAASNFTNSGTVTIGSGTTLTVGGTGNSYNQSAGTTTVDGTLAGGGTTVVSVTGGTVQGKGTLKTNVSLGGGTLNVGDAGKAGLLKITGTYTQLASGTMNVSIGGTAVGSKYSQLQITGAASLGGTLTAAEVNSFTPTVGQTFTVLTAASVTGTFTNSTIAINGTEHFVVSYTATTVVLTVASGAASSTAPGALQMAIANPKPASVVAKPPVAISGLRQRIGVPVKPGKPIFVSGLYREAGHSNAMIGPTWENVRVPHGLPVVSLWHPTSERPTPVSGIAGDRAMRPSVSVSNSWVGGNDVRVSPAPGLIGLSTTHRPAPPVRMLPTHIPIMATVR